jgi:hypothetical protein
MVGVIFFTILFGIIGFGFLLSFQQNVTQAAAEGARAGAVASGGDAGVMAAAQTATEDALDAFDQECTTSGGLVACEFDVHDCSVVPTAADDVNDALVGPNCITVTLEYDHDTNPIIPKMPLIQYALPDIIDSTATAQTND